MRELKHLFENNRAWADAITAEDPEFFSRLAAQQKPEYLWIGCADSRVPANQIVGLLPGELFVHRNVANVVLSTDLNALSVIQFAVEVLKVRHVIVCGHYGCGGVQAALEGRQLGLVSYWLRDIRDLYERNQSAIDALPKGEQVDRLCEMNVQHQVSKLCHTAILREAWKAGQPLTVHGWIYAVDDGLLRDLEVTVSSPDEIPEP